jgi:hypothetical protein
MGRGRFILALSTILISVLCTIGGCGLSTMIVLVLSTSLRIERSTCRIWRDMLSRRGIGRTLGDPLHGDDGE